MVTVPPRRTVGRLLILVVLLLGGLPATAVAFSKAIWGPVEHDGVSDFPLYHRLGASIYEISVNWSLVAPARPAHAANPDDPAYRWPTPLDAAVAPAAPLGIRVMVQIVGSPPWANGGHRDWDWAPRRAGDFAAFATAAARRYPSVHLWMIWGEPSRRGSFNPITAAQPGRALDRAQQFAPHRYAQVLDAAYGALKHVSPLNQVIGGDTFAAGLIDTYQWIENLRLPDGRPPRLDMYGHNPFGPRPPSLSGPPSPFGLVEFPDLRRLAATIDRNLRPGLPLFRSEWTIPTAPDQEFQYWVDASVAAHWITNALRLARGWHRIYALGWIHLYDDPPVSYGGLLTAAGEPKPAFAAFAG
jgi:hypothetical protein